MLLEWSMYHAKKVTIFWYGAWIALAILYYTVLHYVLLYYTLLDSTMWCTVQCI